MPIDPTIISQGMANMPDVNALLQQQISGMENINALERQRRADELVMQDRAAAAAKEQEDAAVKALLPAYAHAFKTGDLRGALNLAPEEYRDSLVPYIDALEGKSPEEIQAALTGSLVTSEVGRAFLENMNRVQTFGVQDRQQKLAELKYEQELAAAGQPKPMSEYETNVIRLRELEAGKTGPDGVKLKAGERMTPEGNVEAVPGSETYRKQKTAQSTDYNAAKNAVRELDKVRGTVKSLKDTTGYQKAMNTGTVMANTPNIPVLSNFTGAYDFQTKYKNLKGAVATLGRAAASLQGKLGNMAVQEWKLVSDSIANLDLDTMSSDELDSQLDIITNDLAALDAQVRDAYDKEWGSTQFYNPLDDRGAAPPAETSPGGDRPDGVGADWSLEEDAKGNRAWVNPQRNKFIEAK